LEVRPVRRKVPRCAFLEGFSLHGNIHLHAKDREGLERLYRYGARGALALERFEEAEDGRIAYRMKRPMPDGTTHLLFTGMEPRAAQPREAGWRTHRPRARRQGTGARAMKGADGCWCSGAATPRGVAAVDRAQVRAAQACLAASGAGGWGGWLLHASSTPAPAACGPRAGASGGGSSGRWT
jgi:hypothetical protein